MVFLSWRAAHQGLNQLKRKKCVISSKVGRTEPSETSDIRHGATRFRV